MAGNDNSTAQEAQKYSEARTHATNPTQSTGINWGADEAGFVLGFVSKALMDLSRDGITLGGGECVGLGLILESCTSALKDAA